MMSTQTIKDHGNPPYWYLRGIFSFEIEPTNQAGYGLPLEKGIREAEAKFKELYPNRLGIATVISRKPGNAHVNYGRYILTCSGDLYEALV